MRMKQKRVFLSALALAGMVSAASAQTSLVLHPKQDGAEVKAFVLDGIRTLTFGDDGLTVNLKDGQTYAAAFDNLATLTFRDESTAIETVTAEYAANLDLFLTDGRLGVNNLRRQWNGEPIAIGHLPKGVYIFKVNNQTLKFTR